MVHVEINAKPQIYLRCFPVVTRDTCEIRDWTLHRLFHGGFMEKQISAARCLGDARHMFRTSRLPFVGIFLVFSSSWLCWQCPLRRVVHKSAFFRSAVSNNVFGFITTHNTPKDTPLNSEGEPVANKPDSFTYHEGVCVCVRLAEGIFYCFLPCVNCRKIRAFWSTKNNTLNSVKKKVGREIRGFYMNIEIVVDAQRNVLNEMQIVK